MYICSIDTLFGFSLAKDHKGKPFIYSSLKEYKEDILSDRNDGVDISDFSPVKVVKDEKGDYIGEDGINRSEVARNEK